MSHLVYNGRKWGSPQVPQWEMGVSQAMYTPRLPGHWQVLPLIPAPVQGSPAEVVHVVFVVHECWSACGIPSQCPSADQKCFTHLPGALPCAPGVGPLHCQSQLGVKLPLAH